VSKEILNPEKFSKNEILEVIENDKDSRNRR
jgi:hypothetical protein